MTFLGILALPLCEPEGGLDAPVGLVNAKDLLRAVLDEPVTLAELARPLKRVSESLHADELLQELRRDRQAPLALVSEQLGIEISNPHEATIGGHVLELLGRLPEPGEEIEIDGRKARVGAVDDVRVVELVFAPENQDYSH